MNTAESIAGTCASLLDEANRKPRPIVVVGDHDLHLMSEAATGRDDQVCIAAYLPWDWPDLDAGDLSSRYLAPLSARLANRVPAGFFMTVDDLELPRWLDDAAQARSPSVNVRAVIMEHPVGKNLMIRDQAKVKPWWNVALDTMEHRAVLPLLRLDVRIKLAESLALTALNLRHPGD